MARSDLVYILCYHDILLRHMECLFVEVEVVLG